MPASSLHLLAQSLWEAPALGAGTAAMHSLQNQQGSEEVSLGRDARQAEMQQSTPQAWCSPIVQPVHEHDSNAHPGGHRHRPVLAWVVGHAMSLQNRCRDVGPQHVNYCSNPRQAAITVSRLSAAGSSKAGCDTCHAHHRLPRRRSSQRSHKLLQFPRHCLGLATHCWQNHPCHELAALPYSVDSCGAV